MRTFLEMLRSYSWPNIPCSSELTKTHTGKISTPLCAVAGDANAKTCWLALCSKLDPGWSCALSIDDSKNNNINAEIVNNARLVAVKYGNQYVYVVRYGRALLSVSASVSPLFMQCWIQLHMCIYICCNCTSVAYPTKSSRPRDVKIPSF